MTLWEIITGNSTLPVQAGNTFWDHLNNQAGGGSEVIAYSLLANKINKAYNKKLELSVNIKSSNLNTKVVTTELLVNQIANMESRRVQL